MDLKLTQDIPEFLYHATYKPLYRIIKVIGLDPERDKNWPDSENVVYLASSPEVAESYAESAESVPDKWLDEIVILQINTRFLDKSKIFDDRNVRSDDSSNSYEYHGKIKPMWIREYKMMNENMEKEETTTVYKITFHDGSTYYGVTSAPSTKNSAGAIGKVFTQIFDKVKNTKRFVNVYKQMELNKEKHGEFFKDVVILDKDLSNEEATELKLKYIDEDEKTINSKIASSKGRKGGDAVILEVPKNKTLNSGGKLYVSDLYVQNNKEIKDRINPKDYINFPGKGKFLLIKNPDSIKLISEGNIKSIVKNEVDRLILEARVNSLKSKINTFKTLI